MVIAKTPHLGKLRVTLHFIRNFSWLSSRKLCAFRKRLSRKSAETLSVGLRSLFPRVCLLNLRELTVHHIDHDHTNNPEDGSNWELLCLYCHDHEHSKYTEADQYGTTVIAGEDAQKDVGEATYNPFADLKAMMNKKK